MRANCYMGMLVAGTCLLVAGCAPGAPQYQKSDLRGAWVRQGGQEMILVFNTDGNLVSISGDLIGVPGADGEQDALTQVVQVQTSGFVSVVIQFEGSSWEFLGSLTGDTTIAGRELIREGESAIANDVAFVRVD